MRTLFTIHSNFYLDQYFSGTYSVKGTIYMYMNARGGGCPLISCYPFSFVYIDNDTNFQRNITSIFLTIYIKQYKQYRESIYSLINFQKISTYPLSHPYTLAFWRFGKWLLFFKLWFFWIGLLLVKTFLF